MRGVFATGAMAPFTAHIPLGHLLRVNIVTDRMTAITKRTSGAMHIVRRIEGRPPIAACRRHYVLAPFVILNFPLYRQRKIVITDFCEITLLPNASIDERDLVLRKLGYIIGSEVRNDRIGVLARIANDVGHRCFLPVLINLLVALGARLRPYVMG